MASDESFLKLDRHGERIAKTNIESAMRTLRDWFQYVEKPASYPTELDSPGSDGGCAYVILSLLLVGHGSMRSPIKGAISHAEAARESSRVKLVLMINLLRAWSAPEADMGRYFVSYPPLMCAL